MKNENTDPFNNAYKALKLIPKEKHVIIYIDTINGTLKNCMRLCRLIKTRSGRTYVYVEHETGSCGTITALCADRIFIDHDTAFGSIYIESESEADHYYKYIIDYMNDDYKNKEQIVNFLIKKVKNTIVHEEELKNLGLNIYGIEHVKYTMNDFIVIGLMFGIVTIGISCFSKLFSSDSISETVSIIDPI
jgi:hypothetical protein